MSQNSLSKPMKTIEVDALPITYEIDDKNEKVYIGGLGWMPTADIGGYSIDKGWFATEEDVRAHIWKLRDKDLKKVFKFAFGKKKKK